MPTNDAGPPEGEVPAQDPIEEIAHTAMDAGEGEVAEGELLDESVDEIVIDSGGDEIARLTAERDEYLAHLQRTQAEFDNYRKRVLREQTSAVELAAQPVLRRLLEVLDDFDLALMHAEDRPDFDRFLHGVELVYAKLIDTLRAEGLERMEVQGKPFDPELHEALMQSGEGDGDPVVADVLRPGYTLKGRVLRPAGVRVERK